MDIILELSGAAGAIVIVGGTVLLALVSYFGARVVVGSRTDSEARELAGSVIFRVSALHGLILALVFAEELVNLNRIKETTSREAALIADVFYDLKRYDAEGTKATRVDLAKYVAAVLDEEWTTLAAEERLSGEAWARWISAYNAILGLKPEGVRQEALKDILLEDIRQIPQLRRTRENAAASGANPLFMGAAIVGVILTSMSFFTFPPSRVNLMLLSVFGGYTGLVIFFIVAFANPYVSPGSIDATGFQKLYTGEVRQLAETLPD